MGRAAIFGEKKHRVTVGSGNYTRRQADVMVYLWDFYQQNDQLPPCHAIAEHFSFASSNAAQKHLEALNRRGWLERNAVGKWKFAQSKREAIRELCNLQALATREDGGSNAQPISSAVPASTALGVLPPALNLPKAPRGCGRCSGCACEVAGEGVSRG